MAFFDPIKRFFRSIVNIFTPGRREPKAVRDQDFVTTGHWVVVPTGGSSYVTQFRYDLRHQYLIVRFTTGGQCTYTNIEPSLAQEMARAPSFGRFVRSRLYYRDYLEKHGH